MQKKGEKRFRAEGGEQNWMRERTQKATLEGKKKKKNHFRTKEN